MREKNGNLTGRMTAGRQLKEGEDKDDESGDDTAAEADAEYDQQSGFNAGKAKAIRNHPPHKKIQRLLLVFVFSLLSLSILCFVFVWMEGGLRGQRVTA